MVVGTIPVSICSNCAAEKQPGNNSPGWTVIRPCPSCDGGWHHDECSGEPGHGKARFGDRPSLVQPS